MAAYCRVYGVIHFTSPAGWLPVHRDQLRAQCSVTSMGKLYLYLTAAKSNGNNDLHQRSLHINSSNITRHHRTLTMSEIHETLFIRSPRPGMENTKILSLSLTYFMFVTIFPWGCTEFHDFSMFREIPEYSRLVATLQSDRQTDRHYTNT